MPVILGMIGAAILAGAIVYIAVRLTMSFIKGYRKRKTSKVLGATVKDLINNGNFPHHALDDLDDDDIVLAEYDPEKDELVQDIGISKEDNNDKKVEDFFKANGGIVIFE